MGLRPRGRPPLPAVPDAGLSAYPLPYLNPVVLADWYGCRPSTVRVWIRVGVLRAEAHGRDWRIPTDEAVAFDTWLDRWLTAQGFQRIPSLKRATEARSV